MVKSADTWEGRRALTDNPNTSPEVSRGAARALMEMNLPSEAAVFFALAGDKEGLRAIIDQAVEEGDYFVFQQAASRLGEEIDREKVRALIASAEKNGRGLYAEKAAEYLQNL